MDDVIDHGGPPELPPLEKIDGYGTPERIALQPATVAIGAVCGVSSGIALVVRAQ